MYLMCTPGSSGKPSRCRPEPDLVYPGSPLQRDTAFWGCNPFFPPPIGAIHLDFLSCVRLTGVGKEAGIPLCLAEVSPLRRAFLRSIDARPAPYRENIP